LFEAVTGRLPFERRSDYALMHAHALEKPPRPRGIRGNLPKALERVILKAIEKEPQRRFQTMPAFRAALVKQGDRYGLLTDTAPERPGTATWASRVGDGLRQRSPVLGGIGIDAALVAVVVVLVLALGIYPGRERPQDDVEPVTRLAAKPRPAVKSAAPAHSPEPASKAEPAPPTEAPPKRKDRYDSLRKAWGG
jgi:serine/threonine-protein kinase